MTEKTYQVGDVVAWRAVPRGALVRSDPGTGLIWYEVRAAVPDDVGFVAGISGDDRSNWWAMDDVRRLPAWVGWSDPEKLVTIVALDVPADATADDLRWLAEIFEVREAIDWQILDFGKPPPGYTVRNTSYEDGDDEVGGYGIMIEEWSWYDGGGYTDSAPTEAGCILSAWEFFEEENQPPGLNPFSGPQAWSWYRGRCAEGGDIAERLHRAGWRPGMTAEDAARLLAAQEATTCP